MPRNLLFFNQTTGKTEGKKAQVREDKLRMEVRYNTEMQAIGLKNELKKGKDDKDSRGNLSKSFFKEQQGSFSPSESVDKCEKNQGSTGDPDYCRRILVRGKACYLSFVFSLHCSIIPLTLYIVLL